ncbi:pyridoxal-phosphate-dependent aminotransferase family protein [Limnochorda pilosa]|uniref:Tritium exchange subunit n=1 Tax=Limnochorda pilosa TaxID=1555112 RepID=A0A0K2SIT6_LIMPI|nr:alanine--glyoxylate aminotransferase family protein [Limnochorda pilosa]BAS27041.1 class V aminotransferase [Limnochorda pilosa]
MEPLLLIPGPTPLPQEVRDALARPMIGHRGEAFATLYRRVTARLKPLFGTGQEVLIFPGSGTGAMEAAVVNLFSPGDRVVALVAGDFGARFAAIADAFGLAVDRLEVPWGWVVSPEALRDRLRTYPPGEVRGVLITHNETSTGALSPVQELARVAHQEAGALVVVDAVSGLGGAPLALDGWGIDLLLTASQKCLMTPPGLALLALSPTAWEAAERARLPRSYWDVREARRFGARGETPYTPAVSLWFALDRALDLIEREGLDAVFERHRRMGAMVRAGARVLGLQVLAGEEHASPTVTCLLLPEGVEPAALRRSLRERGVEVAGGQGALKGSAIRIAHMGATRPQDLLVAVEALGEALREHGRDVSPQAAVEAARAQA